MRKLFFTFTASFFLSYVFSQEKLDMDMITKIKKEGTDNSKVMDIAHHLTDVSGPRLTNSPGFMRAANWARDEFASWGLMNAQLESWGEFGKGWQQEKCYVAMVSPYYQPLIAIPRAWTGGTGKKLLKGEVVLVKALDTTAMAQYAGKLKDKIVMTLSTAQMKPSFEADANRFADTALDRMAAAEMQRQQGGPNQPQQNPQRQNQFSRFAMQRRMNEMISQEKWKFAKDLLRTVEEKREFTLDMIKPRLKNWDADRIAQLDMILMQMGVCEFLFFETIPTKVTINEYIDLAKEYSTPQSGQFVNGILDNIHKDLQSQDKLHKVSFKKN